MEMYFIKPAVLSLRSLAFICTTLLALVSVYSKCNVDPTGVDDVGGIETVNIMSLIDGIKLGQPLPYIFLVLVDDYIGTIVSSYEAPIQFRQTVYHGMNGYNVAAMYHPTALNIWGKGDEQRLCVDKFASKDQKLAHEQIASAYTFAYGALKFNPQVTDAMINIMDNVLQLPMNKILEGNPPTSTPWGLAKYYVDLMAEYAISDGWNADGSLANIFNKMAFNDFSYGDYKGYSPEYNYDTDYVANITKTCKEQAEQAKKVSRGSKISGVQGLKESQTKMKKWPWYPLLESDGHGYFTRQEFVTPHIGFTTRLYGINVTEYEEFYADDPRYDYCFEAEKVIETTRIMATNDEQKARIEMFNSKFTSLLPMQVNWSIMKGFDLFQFWYYDVALVAAMYDAIVLVWREKVLHDMVRPTTVVHTIKGDDMIDSYAGPFNGAQNIKATDWTPYVRTMPHAEYPSGSACVCTAYAETMQVLTRQDDTDIPVTMQILAGSSKSEPGVVPASNITITYNKWSEIQEECGQSRLHGGMHFSHSVPDGEKLCSGVATKIIDRAEMLKNGDPAGAFADITDISITVKSVPKSTGDSANRPNWLSKLKYKSGDPIVY